MASIDARTPVVVDLDLTLILTNSLHEMAAAAIFRKPAALLRSLLKLPTGRQHMKAALANEIRAEGLVFPYREDLLAWLREKAAEGHKIHLCSAAHQSVAEDVARRLGIFASAVGSDVVNLKGLEKSLYLQKKFPDGFIYVGDSSSDIHVWQNSAGIVLAGAPNSVADRARGLGKPILKEFRNSRFDFGTLIKALRVHHWSKNVLIFIPLVLSHQWNTPGLIGEFFLAFLCLLGVTSGTYLLNDVADLSADRQHWSKKDRPLASGRLRIDAGLALAFLLLIASLVGAVLLDPVFALVLMAYLVITGAYSAGLKRIPLLDLLLIGVLFTTRIVMGTVLVADTHPAWLLVFSVFFFFSLAVAKRHTEIVRSAQTNSGSLNARGYMVEDAPLTLALGTGSAVVSLLVMMLFIIESMASGTFYRHPELLGGIPLLLSVWVGRIWLLSHRGVMADDPVNFAIHDRTSIGLGVGIALLFVAAL